MFEFTVTLLEQTTNQLSDFILVDFYLFMILNISCKNFFRFKKIEVFSLSLKNWEKHTVKLWAVEVKQSYSQMIKRLCVCVCVSHYAGQAWLLQSSFFNDGLRAASQRSADTMACVSPLTQSQRKWRLPGKGAQTHTNTTKLTSQHMLKDSGDIWTVVITSCSVFDWGFISAWTIFSPLPQVLLHSVCPPIVQV